MNAGTHLTRSYARAVLLLGLVLACSAHAANAVTALPERTCPAADVRVAAADAKDFDDACAGAQAAIVFFAAHGLRPYAPVVLEVTPVLPAEAGPTAVGCYQPRQKRVFMLPYAEFAKQKAWFKIPIDRHLYRSLAAHETAHAVTSSHFAIPWPTIQAREYVAYVATFATMNAALRARVLRALPGKGFAGEDRITALFYLFDPMRFVAEAYRHYLKPENGPGFLHSVLAGSALAE